MQLQFILFLQSIVISSLAVSPLSDSPFSGSKKFTRMDLDLKDADYRHYYPHPQPLLTKSKKANTYRSNLNHQNPPSSPIAVDFTCAPPPWLPNATHICAKVRHAFEGVFEIVNSAFDLKRPIKVKFEYSSFCEDEEGSALRKYPGMLKSRGRRYGAASLKAQVPAKCASTAGLLGYAAPAAFWIPESPDSSTNLRYSYPQALVKQLTDSSSLINYNEYDIYARFNADQEETLWFKEDGVAISPHQYDFQYIVLHEFMHGMGMVSSWNTPFDGLQAQGTDGAKVLAPILGGDDPADVISTSQATTIFDKFISSTKAAYPSSSMNTYASLLTSKVNAMASGVQLNQVFDALINDVKTASALERSFAAATTVKGLQFSFPDGTSLLLHTEQGQFLSGTSIVHANYDAYTGTSEFLMRPYANNGSSLKSLGGTKPIGPLTLKIFETMGYIMRSTTPSKPRRAYSGKWTMETSDATITTCSTLIALIFLGLFL